MAGLGRGLGALLSESKKSQEERKASEITENTNNENAAGSSEDVAGTGGVEGGLDKKGEYVEKINIDLLVASKFQPRKNFDDNSIAELADSIKEHGLLEPLLVKKNTEDKYEIICGERRFRACRVAGLTEVPCLVREVLEDKAYAIALIENIQREDLNPIEQANALSQMLSECGLTQEDLAKTLGKSRSTITNLLRLNNLHESVKNLVLSGEIDQGHAKVILSVDTEIQPKVAEVVLKKDLTVRQTEEFIKQLKESDGEEIDNKPVKSKLEEFVNWENSISEKLTGIKVKFSGKQLDKGKITLSYTSGDQLQELLKIFGINN